MPRLKKPVPVASPEVADNIAAAADYYPLWTMRLASADASVPAKVIATREEGQDIRADLIVTLPDGTETEMHGVLLVTAADTRQIPKAVLRPQ